jgi:carboxymethylenebutenolidase
MLPRYLSAFALLAATTFAQSAASAPPASALPAALVRLEKSPRHQEWVAVKHGDRTVRAFVVYPEVKDKAMVVVVIHENRGLNDWARAVADRLAENGYIAIAPDLLTGAAPGGGDTKDFAAQNDATAAIGKLPAAQVLADLNAVADYARAQPAANGRLAVAGFCWGGGQVWRFALARPDLALANVFYGAPPADADYAKIPCPVCGYYGGNDARINGSIETSAAGMKAAGKVFEPVIYDGAGHAFMRLGEDADGGAANQKAMTEGWQRLLAALAKAQG